MPEISSFYGIKIIMDFDEHNPPHFHCEYYGGEALFDIVDGVFMHGRLPTKQSRLVLAWYEIHKEELMDNWDNLPKGNFNKIEPLK